MTINSTLTQKEPQNKKGTIKECNTFLSILKSTLLNKISQEGIMKFDRRKINVKLSNLNF